MYNVHDFQKNFKNQISTNKTTSSFMIFFGFLSFFVINGTCDSLRYFTQDPKWMAF